MITKNLKEIGSYIFVIGKTSGHLFQSEFFREVVGFKEGPPPEISLFNEKNNGETIYNTKRGPIDPSDEIASTQKGNKVFIHILDSNKEMFFIENFNLRIKNISYYKSTEKVDFIKNESGLLLKVPNDKKNPIDTILELEIYNF